MSEQSNTSADLYLLESAQDLREHALTLAQRGRRQLKILSHRLDPILYDNEGFASALSSLARYHRNSQVQILVKDTKPLIERGHALIRLAQRLPSKVEVRQIKQEVRQEADNHSMGFILIDSSGLLYINDDNSYSSDVRGFANYAAGPEVKNFNETFQRLWQYSEPDPNLRQLKL